MKPHSLVMNNVKGTVWNPAQEAPAQTRAATDTAILQGYGRKLSAKRADGEWRARVLAQSGS